MCTTLKLIKVNSERSFWQFIPHSVLAFGLCVSEAFLREVLGVGWSSSGMSVIVIFYLAAKTCMFNSVSRIYYHVSTIVIKLTSASENQILFCEDSSLCNFDCPQMRPDVFFYKWSRENIPLPPGNVEIQYITFFFRKRYKRTKKRNHA